MQTFEHIVALTAPLFILVLLGYGLTRWAGWPKPVSDALTRFVFAVAIPALLFRLMSDFSRLPPVDPRLLIAYFGSCFIVFAVGRFIANRVFRMDGVSQSVFALGGIFANVVLLGVPLAKITLGEESIPVVSLVVVFNSLTLWTLVTVSVEWARHRKMSWSGYVQAAKAVLTNPVVASILLGTGWGLTAIPLPAIVDGTLELISQAAVPLVADRAGDGTRGISHRRRMARQHDHVRAQARPSAGDRLLLARWLALPPLETQAIVMLASLPVGANVYLMSRQFNTLGGPVAASLVISTALSAVTTPMILAFTARG